MSLGHIAAKNLHGSDTQRQGEKRLIHGGSNHIAEAHMLHNIPVGHQKELHALRSPFQGQGMYRQHHNQHQQCPHHHLGNTLQPLLQAKAAHKKAKDNGQHRPESHLQRTCQQAVEHAAYLLNGLAGVKLTLQKLEKIRHHPA